MASTGTDGVPAGSPMAAAGTDGAPAGSPMASAGTDGAPAGSRKTVTVPGYEGLTAELELIDVIDGTSVRVVISHNGGALTWDDFVDGLVTEAPALRDLMTEVLRQMDFPAFFWECVCVSRGTSDRPFEFVVVDSPELASLTADPGPFKDKLEEFRGQEISRAFTNKGGDSMLIAPACAGDDEQVYAHAANFFRGAPPAQRDLQWRMLGEEIRKRFTETDAPFWVSTAGKGVYWLHHRLDPTPKYYKFQAYKDANYGVENKAEESKAETSP